MTKQLPAKEKELRSLLVPRVKMIESLMGDPNRAKKFSATLLAAGLNPNLARCTPQSIIEAGIAAAVLQLLPDPNLGQAYLVPYKTKTGATVCQLQIGYRGFITMLERIGWHLKAYAVYSVDDFSFEVDGWDERLHFKPNFDERQTDPAWTFANLVKVVTVVKSRDGELFYQVMPKQEIEKIRLKSQTQKDPRKPSGIWWEWYEQMAIKSAIKRHIKRLPLGDQDVTVALGVDDVAEKGAVPDYERFNKEGVVIEADVSPEPKQAEQRDIDALLIQGQTAPDPWSEGEASNEREEPEETPDPSAQLVAELIRRRVKRSAALKYVKANENSMEALLEDPGALDAIAEELRAG
ncbi:RecT protein [Nitratifractor salsuginis DSM 16511]|uniref:RecT protein n=1 Tax=Nitratifractor salsuginis (strain DSM 16511 / JCM 12458 / E9I37-1) TaxID=749222 RepID=E6WZ40_NITSE|nr:RecT protein [Nitratifractor salsuginis DSM 16511]